MSREEITEADLQVSDLLVRNKKEMPQADKEVF